MIKTILFDIDGVLLDSFDANFEFYRRLFIKTGYTPPTKEFFKETLFQKTMLGVIQTVTGVTDANKIQQLMEIGKQRDGIYPYELIKTPPTLNAIIESLHKKFTLGLVSSRIKNGIFEIPQLKVLEKYFSVVVSFEDTEKHKPDPAPLLLAIQQLHGAPEDIIYIGDQESDFLAAKAAGTKIIMLTEKPFPDADAQVSAFDDIPSAITKVA